MKNQYIGDIGDYGKYGLLRFLKDSGIEIGINWYLTPNDGTTDGKYRDYLHDERMRIYDPEIFDAMKRIAFQDDKSITQVEQEKFLDGICFLTKSWISPIFNGESVQAQDRHGMKARCKRFKTCRLYLPTRTTDYLFVRSRR